MKFFYLTFLLLAATLSVTAQQSGRINGKLTLPKTASPAAKTEGVKVRLRASAGNATVRETTSDSAGQFAFGDLAPGSYAVEIECASCVRSGKATTIDVPANGEAEVAIELPIASISETVTVAADTAQPIETVAKAVDVIGGQEMRDRADFTLVDSLRTIPGFRVQQLGGFGRTASIKSRGLRNQDTAVLIDGVRFRDPSSISGDATPFLSDLTLTSVSRVEVLRGSGSSLYGTNAIGGVVNFETPSARSGTHGQVSGNFGGMGFGRFRGTLSHGTKDGKYGIGGGVSRTAFTKGIDGDDNADNTNFQMRTDLRPTTRTTISGAFFFSNAKVRLNVGPDTAGTLPAANNIIIDADPFVNFTPDVDDPDALQRSRFFSGHAKLSQQLSKNVILSGYYHVVDTRRRNDDGVLGPGFQSASTSVFDGRIDTINAKLTWAANGSNTVSGGYEFERERFGNEGLTPAGTSDFFTRATQSSDTFFLQALSQPFAGRLTLSGGIRYQRYRLGRPAFSLTGSPYQGVQLDSPDGAFTLDGAIAYSFRTGTKLRAHVGNGYRVPSLYERFGTFYSAWPSASFVALGDPSLRPERSIAFDLGVDQSALRNRLKLSASYFWTRLTDIIGYGSVVPDIGTTPRPYGGYENQKGGRSSGFEGSVTAKPTRTTDLFASYTYTESRNRISPVSGSGVLRAFGIPRHQFTLVATQNFGRFWVNFDLLATSDYLAPIFSNSTFSTYVYRFQGNRKGDLTAGYTFKLHREDSMKLCLYGTIENVFNNEYFENGFRTASRTGRLGVTFGF
ncbi:MAG TPA: TonB-dependent receptor [Pyrinomonadaceae bacterium]|nr:TonB-dependent receptor [Pyrinomonadaceae bacterium]